MEIMKGKKLSTSGAAPMDKLEKAVLGDERAILVRITLFQNRSCPSEQKRAAWSDKSAHVPWWNRPFESEDKRIKKRPG